MGCDHSSPRNLPQTTGRSKAETADTAAAARHGRTPARIVLRWQVRQDGVVAIPRSGRPEHIAQNLRVFDFALEAGEMAALDALGSRRLRIRDFEFSPEWDAA